MEVPVQLLSGMSGLQKNCGNGNYPREIRAEVYGCIKVSLVNRRIRRLEDYPR
jgi:hypothetical protein